MGWHGACLEPVWGHCSQAPVSLCAVASWRYRASSNAVRLPTAFRSSALKQHRSLCWDAGLMRAVPGSHAGKHCCEPTNSHQLPKFLVHKCRRRPALRPAAWPRLFGSSLLSLLSVQQFFHLCISLFWKRKFRANYVLIIALLSIYIFRLLHSGIRLSKLC